MPVLEFVMPGQSDWLGNTPPEQGCLVTGARYSFSVNLSYTDVPGGTYGWDWELFNTAHPAEPTWIVATDAFVTTRITETSPPHDPEVLRTVALACATAARTHLGHEAEKQSRQHHSFWPTRNTWPENEWDGYNPAERSFESVRLARERCEWTMSVVQFLRERKT